MGLVGLYMGKATRVLKNLVGSAVFLKLVRSFGFNDPAGAENRVVYRELYATCSSQLPTVFYVFLWLDWFLVFKIQFLLKTID